MSEAKPSKYGFSTTFRYYKCRKCKKEILKNTDNINIRMEQHQKEHEKEHGE